MRDETATAPDRDARRRIVASSGRSLLIEASAGTGKTYVLIEAILHRALEDGIPLSHVAALTFTEKAAGELKARVRRRLEGIAADPKHPRRARAREALSELESAEVSTIHAFCLSLLRERPFEAGLEPGFAQIDPAASRELGGRVWDDWWREILAEEPDGPAARALQAGVALGRADEELGTSLRQLALELYDGRTRLDGAVLPSPTPATLEPLFARWRDALRAAIADAATGAGAVVAWLSEIADFLDGLSRSRSLEDIAKKSLAFPAGDFRAGTRGLWNDERKDEVMELVNDEIKPAFKDGLLAARLTYWPILDGTLRHLAAPDRGFLAAVEAEKRRRNVVDFDDLLLLSRDLLRRSADARAHFRRRFHLLAIDEFQDTDPIQMEIALRLSARDGAEADWRDIAPAPGRLIVVGDPKQSIYRFRKADVETYRDATRALERETLAASRRSAPEILRWINQVFSTLLREEPTKAFEIGYAPLEAWGSAAFPEGPHVLFLEPPEEFDEKTRSWKEQEAAAVARDIAGRLANGETRARQVAILVRTNDRVADFQEALARLLIPAVLEGGTEFFRREETGAVLAALRALENPFDAVSVVAALKSFLFSIPDSELAAWRLEDRRFTVGSPQPRGRVGEALERLAALRARRHQRPADETLLELYETTGAVESARASAHGLQAAANLERLAFVAGDLSYAGLPFGAVVRALAVGAGKDTGEPRAFEEDADAVRILTMHKAKGLEFDAVYVTGLSNRGGSRTGRILFGGPGGAWGTIVSMGGLSIATPGYEDLERLDKERERAEEKRLFYVAATRARHRLIVSMWQPPSSSDLRDRTSTPLGRFWPALSKTLADRLATSSRAGPAPVEAEAPSEANADEVRIRYEHDLATLAARPALNASRSLPLRRAGRPPGSEAPPEDRPRGEKVPGDRELAARLGSAVHQAMQALIERGLDPDAAAAEAAAAWSLPAEAAQQAARFVARLAGSALYRRAGAASRRLAETPLLYRDRDGVLVEGVADLLFEEPSGWVLVDYKTDRNLALEMELYRRQLSDYAAAIAALGGPVVREAFLLHAPTGEAVPVSLPE